jgi:hypothetical protein
MQLQPMSLIFEKGLSLETGGGIPIDCVVDLEACDGRSLSQASHRYAPGSLMSVQVPHCQVLELEVAAGCTGCAEVPLGPFFSNFFWRCFSSASLTIRDTGCLGRVAITGGFLEVEDEAGVLADEDDGFVCIGTGGGW